MQHSPFISVLPIDQSIFTPSATNTLSPSLCSLLCSYYEWRGSESHLKCQLDRAKALYEEALRFSTAAKQFNLDLELKLIYIGQEMNNDRNTVSLGPTPLSVLVSARI
jgi:hypothetical protein